MCVRGIIGKVPWLYGIPIGCWSQPQ